MQRFARGQMARRFCNALRTEAAAKAEEERRVTAAAIVFQCTWRRRCAVLLKRQLYAKAQRDCAAATRLQAAGRGYMARQRVNALRKAYAEEMDRRRSAAIVLQAAWRGCAARASFHQLLCLREQAALCIQCAIRCWQARNQLSELKTLAAEALSARQMEFAALTLQRAASCWLARCRLRELRYQAAQEAQQQQAAATAIQMAIRSWLAKCSLRRLRQQAALEAQRRACAATAIQSAIRGWLAQRHVAQLRHQAAQEAQRRASAVTVMQAAVRGWLARRLFAYLQEAAQHRWQQEEKEAAVLLLQRVVRGCLARQEACQRQRAALMLTRWARATLLGRRAQRVAGQRRWAVVVLQRHAHAMFAMRAARTELALLREQQRRGAYISRWVRCAQQSLAAMTLQHAWRRTVAARASSAEIRAASRLQAIARGFLARTQVSAALQAARQARRERAAIKIQAAYRAYRTRSTMSRRLKEIHRKVMIINAGVEEHMKLGNRATSALEILLKHKQLSYVLRAVRNLNAVTRWSRGCCLRLVEHDAVHILFEVIRSCNRSKPHMAVLVHSIQILVHLASQACTRDAVFDTADCLSVATDLMQMFRDKPEVVAPTALLLSVASTHEMCRSAFLKKEPAFKRLKSAVLFMERKASLSKPVAPIKGRRPEEKTPTPVEVGVLGLSLCRSFLLYLA
jgi:abnormal spindle-like microcephaly-associated protein